MIDIGANIGIVTAVLAELVGSKGRVYAFEPNPELCGLLRKMIKRNQYENVSLYETALGDEEGELELAVPHGHSGGASFVRRTQDSASVRVSVRRLSPILRDADAKSVRLVKLDVEGFELEVLLGAREWFKDHAPDAILFELNDSATKQDCHPTVRVLQELGFAFFSIPRTLIRPRLREYKPDEGGVPESSDLLAVRTGEKLAEIGPLVSR
ncbi:MAG: FkbM family methyltransferase [Phycisphaerae bacterium]|nr:FkbM family methyltransferase [Phycisphaerae bacterium]